MSYIICVILSAVLEKKSLKFMDEKEKKTEMSGEESEGEKRT